MEQYPGDLGFPAQSAWTTHLEEDVRAAASIAGFHLCGIASAESAVAKLSRDNNRFASWIEQGRAGEMEYLKRQDDTGAFLRSHLQVAIPWAKSVVVCALNYDSSEVNSIAPSPTGAGWIGRYAWSGRREFGLKTHEEDSHGSNHRNDLLPTDYHDELLSRLRLIESRLIKYTPCQTRCYVDTGPIVERDFAARTGIGWIGKNTCVINQDLGSWLLLGVIVTSLSLASDLAPHLASDRCGSCTRCIDACPTDALVAPREMDASRCIAYLTIEKKGVIGSEFREAIGRQVFGCDICQDVCPWNKRNTKGKKEQLVLGNSQPPSAVTAGMEVRKELVNPSLDWLASMDSSAFKRSFKGSPLERTGKKRLHRNVAIAMGNSGQDKFLPQLQEWSLGEDSVLAEAARWAIERIRSASIES